MFVGRSKNCVVKGGKKEKILMIQNMKNYFYQLEFSNDEQALWDIKNWTKSVVG